jgi:gliding motility-associated-like protein
MGMYVTINQPPDPTFVQNIPANPQIMNPQYRMLIGRDYWMKICGSFVAQGGENFITIGSFLDDDQSTFLELPGCEDGNYGVHWSYYHIDDVLFEQYDSTANYDCDDTTVYENPNETNTDSLGNCNIDIPNVFSPNGDSQNEYLDTDFPMEKYTFYIYDRWGREVYYTWQNDNRAHYWDGRKEGKPLGDGVYFYILTSSTEECQQTGTITILR